MDQDPGGLGSMFTCGEYFEPESVFRLSYEVEGAAPVAAAVAQRHVEQDQRINGLREPTDPALQRQTGSQNPTDGTLPTEPY